MVTSRPSLHQFSQVLQTGISDHQQMVYEIYIHKVRLRINIKVPSVLNFNLLVLPSHKIY